MKNQKSRRINRKQTKRKTIKHKTTKRKTTKRKTTKRKTTKRKTTKRKQSKKIVYNQKKMYGGKFNPEEEEILKKSLERFNFNEEEWEEVIKTLGYGGHEFSGKKIYDLAEYLNQGDDDKDKFMEWLGNIDDGYVHAVEDDETDNEDNDDEDDEDDDDF